MFIKILISLLLLSYLLVKINIGDIKKSFEFLNGSYLFLGMMVCHADRMLMAFKWKYLFQSSGLSVTASLSIINTYIGNFAGQFLPAGVGGDLIRIFLFKKAGLPIREVASSIVVERILGLFALVCIGLIASITTRHFGVIYPFSHRIVVYLFLLLSLVIIISYLPFSLKVFGYIKQKADYYKLMESFSGKIYDVIVAYQKYSNRKNVLVMFFLLSLVEVSFVVIIFFLCCESLNLEVGILRLFMIVPIVLLIQRIPISVNGIGVQEGLLCYFFINMGQSIENSFSLSLVLRILEITIIIPGAGLYIFERNKIAEKI